MRDHGRRVGKILEFRLDLKQVRKFLWKISQNRYVLLAHLKAKTDGTAALAAGRDIEQVVERSAKGERKAGIRAKEEGQS